jgi:hypothetical protein
VDRPRSGRPRRFTAVRAAQVESLACELPAATGVPLSLWSAPQLAREAIARGVAPEGISSATVRRWLAAEAIKPWQYRSWLFPRDPDFAAKAGRVLDLYEGRWEDVSLRGRAQETTPRKTHPPASGEVLVQSNTESPGDAGESPFVVAADTDWPASITSARSSCRCGTLSRCG